MTPTLRQRLESACALNELSETLKNSTRVVAWYAHGPGDQSPLDTATVRGPYGRWFYVNGGADYPKNVAYVADDAKYAAASMNAIPKLIPLLSALIDVVQLADESTDWLCDHVGAHPRPGERNWCAECHNWVYPTDVGFRDRVQAALARVSELCGEGNG